MSTLKGLKVAFFVPFGCLSFQGQKNYRGEVLRKGDQERQWQIGNGLLTSGAYRLEVGRGPAIAACEELLPRRTKQTEGQGLLVWKVSRALYSRAVCPVPHPLLTSPGPSASPQLDKQPKRYHRSGSFITMAWDIASNIRKEMYMCMYQETKLWQCANTTFPYRL